jgi:hypothetical protein
MPSGPSLIQSWPAMTRRASIRGPERLAVLICQHSRSPSGLPVLGPHGPAMVSR